MNEYSKKLTFLYDKRKIFKKTAENVYKYSFFALENFLKHGIIVNVA